MDEIEKLLTDTLATEVRQLKAEIERLRREKDARVYYQNIVYAVCNVIDEIDGAKPGAGIVCGTLEAPSDEVQLRMQVLVGEVRRLRRELGARVYHQIGKVRRLRARLREQTDETQRAGERIDAAICDALAHLGIDISDRVGKTPIEQIVGGVVVGLQTENERLREACRSVLSTRPCDDCYEEGCDWECGCVCHRSMESAQEALRAALAAGGEVRP